MDTPAKRRPSYPPARLTGGEALSFNELLKIDIFQGLTADDLAMRPGTVAQRRFAKGDVICRQGDGGTTAFYIAAGTAKVFVAVHNHRPQGWFARAMNRLRGERAPVSDKLIANDATIDLTESEPEATLGPGDLFGELSCMYLTPRAATVVAAEDCVMFEMLRNVLELLKKKSKAFVAKANRAFRERTLLTHLKTQPFFSFLPQSELAFLQSNAELRELAPGEVLFRQGDSSRDPHTGGLYLVRSGHVQVSVKTDAGHEQTLAYRGKGECVGEIGLVEPDPQGSSQRMATCRAADQTVEYGSEKVPRMPLHVVRIAPEHLDEVISRHPRVRGLLAMARADKLAPPVPSKSLPVLRSEIAQSQAPGLWQGENLMFIDLTRCTRCDYCVDACVATHDDGVSRLVREGPREGRFLIPSSCRQCMDPVCMLPCPVGAIRKSKDGPIVIEDWCFGCKLCAEACPYDAIQMHGLEEFAPETLQRAEKAKKDKELVYVNLLRAVVCDQCSSLPTGPACVSACPHDAAIRFNAATSVSHAMDDRGVLGSGQQV